jgi:hypothetical protein
MIRVIALRLTCRVCGHTVRVTAPDTGETLCVAASRWWVEHRDPVLAGVEMQAGDGQAEWVNASCVTSS